MSTCKDLRTYPQNPTMTLLRKYIIYIMHTMKPLETVFRPADIKIVIVNHERDQ